MIGILIVTHGDLGQSLIACTRHILQREPENLACMAVDKSDDPEKTTRSTTADSKAR